MPHKMLLFPLPYSSAAEPTRPLFVRLYRGERASQLLCCAYTVDAGLSSWHMVRETGEGGEKG